jgi:hypothetical protein
LEVLLNKGGFSFASIDLIIVICCFLSQSVGQVLLLLNSREQSIDFCPKMLHFIKLSLLLTDGLLQLGILLFDCIDFDLFGGDFLPQPRDKFILLIHDIFQSRIVREFIRIQIALQKNDIVVVLVDCIVQFVDFLLQIENLILLRGNSDVLLAETAD